MKNHSLKLAARDIAECALFTALMITGAFIKIPFPFVALTFQTAFAVLSGLLLGWKKGIISTSAYAVLGLIGVPVFTNGGGLMYVTMPSFGYILGFIASAAIAGIAYVKFRKIWQIILIAVLACVADYVLGIAYFIAVWQLNGYEGLWSAVVTYNLLYLPKDLLLSVLAALLSRAVAPVLRKMRGEAKGECSKISGQR